jgi:Glycosyl hydrolase family 3 N terminal domain
MTDPAINARVDELLAAMTVEEKAGQLTQYFYFGSLQDADAGPTEDLPPSQQAAAVEAALARGEVGSLLFVTDPAETNRLQRLAVEGNRHGLPALFGFDVVHGLRTILPVPIAMAASWDPATIERGQTVAAREARAVGIHWTFAPMVDIARDPRWGRIIEEAGRTRSSAAPSPRRRSAGSRARTWAPRSTSSPDPSTSRATAPRSADGTTTRSTCRTTSCGTSTSRPSRRRSPRARAT